jgi:hypothetical protein
MVEDWKSATLCGIILWALIFAEISVLMFTPGLEGNQSLQKMIHLVILPVLVILCSYMYFKGSEASLKEGFVLGILFLIVGTVLDLLITVPIFVKSFDFYLQWSLWVGFLEVVVFSSLAGYFLGKRTS